MSAQWTPGPWYLKSFKLDETLLKQRNDLILDEGGRIIGYARRGPEFNPGEGEANARLMAAAPLMLKAIQRTLEFVGDEEITRSDGEKLDVSEMREAVERAINMPALSEYLKEYL